MAKMKQGNEVARNIYTVFSEGAVADHLKTLMKFKTNSENHSSQ